MSKAAGKTYPPDQDRALRTWISLARCYASVSRAADRMIRSYGLTTPQFALMEALYHLGPLPLSEIGQKLLVTGGNVTYVMDNLCELGLVIRERCAADRRVIYAKLTPKGDALIARIFPTHAKEVQELFSVLSTEEQDSLRTLLKKLGHAELGARRASPDRISHLAVQHTVP
jgi:MarR family transcriptional regulator, 2-MHQ and catechol-resistance regulon repressor